MVVLIFKHLRPKFLKNIHSFIHGYFSKLCLQKLIGSKDLLLDNALWLTRHAKLSISAKSQVFPNILLEFKRILDLLTQMIDILNVSNPSLAELAHYVPL